MRNWLKAFLLSIITIVTVIPAQEHILVTEIGNGFQKAFIELHNPTAQSVSLENYYLTNAPNYYDLTTGSITIDTKSFLAQFPSGSELGSGETIVIAFDGEKFQGEFNMLPDYELYTTDFAQVPDMIFQGTSLKKFGTADFIMLFSWDGITDLVSDIDYFVWKGTTPRGVDKTGVTIGAGTYENDTPLISQKLFSYNDPMERVGPVEIEETSTNGNGLLGHDETSENMIDAWQAIETANPGDFIAAGRGRFSLTETVFDKNTSDITLEINFTTPQYFTLMDLRIVIPGGVDGLSWAQNSNSVVLNGDAFSSSQVVTVEADTITISGGSYTAAETGKIDISGISTPDAVVALVVDISTRGNNESFMPVQDVLTISVVDALIPIADIQHNFNFYNGKTVNITGIVTIGVNTIQTGRTNIFIQDNSGRGINISSFVTYDEMVRGSEFIITGTVGIYNEVTQITPTTLNLLSTDNELPAAAELTTSEANDFDEYDGTWIHSKGLVKSFSEAGGGANIDIDDGSGNLLVRIWNTTGINTSDIRIGDTLSVHGVPGIFNSEAQLLPSLQEDVIVTRPGIEGDGSGFLTLLSSSTLPSTGTFDMQVKFTAGSYPINRLVIYPSAGMIYDDLLVENDLSVPASAADKNGFVLDDLGLSAGSSVTITIKTATIVNDMMVNKYTDGITGADSVVTVIMDQKIPLFAHSAVGTEGSVAQPIGNYITANVGAGSRYLIGDVQNHFLYFNGLNISVTGRMTISPGTLRNDFTSAYIQDESRQGINIYNNTLNPSLQRGRTVKLTGQVTEFGGVTEISYSSAVLTGDASTLVPRTLKLTISEAQDFAKYDGTFLELRGLVKDMVFNIGGGDNIVLGDATGFMTVRVWATTGLNTAAERLDSLFVKGVLSTYRDEVQITPTEGDDYIVADAPAPPLALTVPAHPFVPELGETFTITFGTGNKQSHIRLKLYNMAGRLVMALLDEDFFNNEYVWDGRNSRGEPVPAGVYVLHLEVKVFETGEKSTKIAPVVIGKNLN